MFKYLQGMYRKLLFIRGYHEYRYTIKIAIVATSEREAERGSQELEEHILEYIDHDERKHLFPGPIKIIREDLCHPSEEGYEKR